MFSPDGELILTASDDGTVRWWDGKTGKNVGIIDFDASLSALCLYGPTACLGLSNGQVILSRL